MKNKENLLRTIYEDYNNEDKKLYNLYDHFFTV